MESNWFTGPSFLQQEELPKGEKIIVGEIAGDPELRAQVHISKAKEQKSLLDCLGKFSDWKRMVKAIASLKLCARNDKGMKERCNASTVLEEKKDAEMYIIRRVQEEVFSDEIKALKQKKEVKAKQSTRLY